jgi:hypothetical protein
MARFALINPSNAIDRMASNVDPNVQTKTGWKWLPCDPVAQPSFDPTTEKVTGPTYTVGASSVTEIWTKVSLTAQEISDRKDAAVNGLNGTVDKPLLQILLTVVNDNRAVRAKLNALIDATGQAATVTKYPNNQTTVIDMTQLKAAIKALL